MVNNQICVIIGHIDTSHRLLLLVSSIRVAELVSMSLFELGNDALLVILHIPPIGVMLLDEHCDCT